VPSKVIPVPIIHIEFKTEDSLHGSQSMGREVSSMRLTSKPEVEACIVETRQMVTRSISHLTRGVEELVVELRNPAR
jgi:hypothetical protein